MIRKPETIEHLYLDFDGFFASCEQMRDPSLRGKPVGVVPYEGGRMCIIACSREAKAQGVKNVMSVDEAKKLCPDLLLVPQKPDLYRRAHTALLAEISAHIPVDSIKSIDELSCRLDAPAIQDPQSLGERIKRAIRQNFGSSITCSIGFAANRHLAKIAGGTQKPDGLTVWHPHLMPAPLLCLPLDDIPGVGRRMSQRLAMQGITTTSQLLAIQPKHMRALWHNVNGERLWYALHGYDVQSSTPVRGMFGHTRVLPPDARDLPAARAVARLLLTKAARRLRRDNYYASGVMLWLALSDSYWSDYLTLPQVRDDKAFLDGLAVLWARMERHQPSRRIKAFRVGVTLCDLTPASARQLDMFTTDDAERQKWEAIGDALDSLNTRYASTVVSIGPWNSPKGGNVGGKISFTRIPSAEDFW